MMKKITWLFLFIACWVNAQTFNCGGIQYTVISGTTDVSINSGQNGLGQSYSGALVLPSIVSNAGTDYTLTSIGNNAFYFNGNLTSVTLPASVTSIGNNAFENCFFLTSINIPNSITSISNGTFFNCSRLTSIIIPNSVTSIGNNAFARCSELTSIIIPNSVTSIGTYAFAYCSNLDSITLPNSITSIANGTFYICEYLTSITIPNSVTSIGNFAFKDCKLLNSINIPNLVTSIDFNAFENCYSLTSLTLPASVTSIGAYAFSACYRLTTFICLNPTPVAINANVFQSVNQGACNLIVPVGSVAAYDAAAVWTDFLGPFYIPTAPTATSPQSFCSAAGATLATVVATPDAGGAINWYDAATAGSLLANTTALVDGTTYYASQTVSGFESPTRTAVLVNINASPTVSAGTAPAPACPGTNVTLTGTSSVVQNGFTGSLAPSNWVFSNTNADGTVNIASLPNSIALTGGNNGSGSSGNTNYTITIPASGTISFNWVYSTTDLPIFDRPQVINNGTASLLNGYNLNGSQNQSGTMTVNVIAGQTFSFNMRTSDNDLGAATTVFSNLVYTASPTVNWSTTNGTLVGATNGLTATASAAGTYTLTATSAAGCVATSDVVVSYLTPTTPTFTQVAAICAGATLAALPTSSNNATAITGTWSPAINNTATTIYTFTPAASECATAATMTVTVNAQPTSTVESQTNVSCFGASNGTATVTNTAGNTYSWSPSGGNSNVASGLDAGNYTCTVTTTATGCSKELNVTITQPNALTSSISTKTDVSCNGGNNGSATVSVSGGTGSGSYTYAWSPSGGTAATASGLSAGAYTCTITDANGCTTNQSVFILQPAQPTQPTLACYESATFNTNTCAWVVSGTQPTQPTLACYESATFNTNTCAWVVTGTQPTQQTLACYETATFNTTTCAWVVSGTQPIQPTLACYESATFNTNTCAWVVSGTQPTQPTLACYESATFNTNTCAWVVSGTQPTQPTLACYESATFNTNTCAWVVSGTQPTQPTLACYQTATFNTTTCAWVVSGTQPTQPTLACYESATFNTNTCAWVVSGTQPTQPTLACYESATFNTTTCTWVVSGTQPTQPTLACYESATFNTTTCAWVVSGTPIALPTTPDDFQYVLAGATIANLSITGTAIQWYASATSAAPLPTTTVLVSGTTYYASQTINGCESARVEIDVYFSVAATHLDFDGFDDYIVANNSNLPLGTSNRTVEFWFKTSTTFGSHTLFSYGNFLPANNRIALINASGKLYFSANNNDFNTNVSIADNNWHHVAYTFDGTSKIYLDGVLIASPTLATFATSGTEIILGAGNTSFFETFNGSLDEVRIWNIALSQSEIQNTMNCELPAAQTGVVAYYNFNQGFNAYANTTETTLTNSVAGGGNGTLFGFDLDGTSSNWLAGSPVTTGTTCAVFLETESFESAVNMSIYPNPTNGIVNLKTNEPVNVEIFDLLGKSINDSKIETGIATFDFSNYASGVYLVKATNNNGATKTFKVLKN